MKKGIDSKTIIILILVSVIAILIFLTFFDNNTGLSPKNTCDEDDFYRLGDSFLECVVNCGNQMNDCTGCGPGMLCADTDQWDDCEAEWNSCNEACADNWGGQCF